MTKSRTNTIGEYEISATVAAMLSEPFRMLVGNSWTESESGKTLEVVDPASDQVLTTVPAGNANDIDNAVQAAQAAMCASEWAGLSPGEREALLVEFANQIESNADMLAEVITLESGKPKSEAEDEVADAVGTMRYVAGWTTRLEGYSVAPVSPIIPGKEAFGYTRKEPVGVVGAVIPWNFPLINAVDRVAPALTAGCAIVLKPAEQTPLSALLLARIGLESGLPGGAFNVVTGLGPDAGAPLAAHPGIAKIAFTGSTAVGKLIGKAAMENITDVNLELGGKSPMIVLEDGIGDDMLEWLGAGIYYNSGQVCTAGSRLYAHKKVFDKIVADLADMAGSMKLGHGLAEETEMGPLVSRTQQDCVLEYIESGVESGAEIVTGGRKWGSSGCFVEPTLFVNVSDDARIVREEIFGPVLTAVPFSSEEEVVAKANDTRYGLTASIWSNDFSRINRLVPRLKAGIVWVNAHNLLDVALPFGGYRQSGIGRENGFAGVDEFLETKTVIMYY